MFTELSDSFTLFGALFSLLLAFITMTSSLTNVYSAFQRLRADHSTGHRFDVAWDILSNGVTTITSFISELCAWRTSLLSVAFVSDWMIASMRASTWLRAHWKAGSTRNRRHSDSRSAMTELFVEACLKTRAALAGMADVFAGMGATCEAFVAHLKAIVLVLNAADLLAFVHSAGFLLAAAFVAQVFSGSFHDLQILITWNHRFGSPTATNH